MEKIIIRVDRKDPFYSSIAFLDSGPDCNRGRIMFWDRIGGHGEGLPRYVATRDTRPATADEARGVLEAYCRFYGADPAGYRNLQRLPAGYTPGNC